MEAETLEPRHPGRVALVDLTTVALLVVSLILLIRFRLNSALLVIGGATIGLLLRGRIW